MTDEAIVLRTYNVGEADRFCVLFTKTFGRVVARAHGARRLLQKNKSGLLPLHRISLTLEEHSFGYVVSSSSRLEQFQLSLTLHQFSRAMFGIEILVKLTEDLQPLPGLYALATSFLDALPYTSSSLLPILFGLSTLLELGFLGLPTHCCITGAPLPLYDVVYSSSRQGFCALHHDHQALPLHPEATLVLRSLASRALDIPVISSAAAYDLQRLLVELLGNQLGVTLASLSLWMDDPVAPIPICHVTGRAS